MALELVRELHNAGRGFKELYRRGDEHFAVSTINIDEIVEPAAVAIGRMSALVNGTATSGEETMAFRCDSDGVVLDWTAAAVAHGPDSRQAVLADLGDHDA